MIEISIDKINEVIVVDQTTLSQVFAEGKAGDIVDKIEKDVRSFIFEVETAKGRKDIASVAYKIARAKKTIDDAGKQVSAEYKAKAKAFDQVRSQLWSRLESLQEEIRSPLTQFEETEKNRISEHHKNLDHFNRIVNLNGCQSFNSLEERVLDSEKSIVFVNELLTSRSWEEFNERANQLHEKAVLILKTNIAEYKLKIAEEKQAQAEKATREAEEKIRLLAEAEANKVIKLPEENHIFLNASMLDNHITGQEERGIFIDDPLTDIPSKTAASIRDEVYCKFKTIPENTVSQSSKVLVVMSEENKSTNIEFPDKLLEYIHKNIDYTENLMCDIAIDSDKELNKYLAGKKDAYKEIIDYIQNYFSEKLNNETSA